MDGTSHTAAYFDSHVHDYPPARVSFILDTLKRTATASQTLVDIGCGSGNVLALLKKETPLTNLCGIDASGACLQRATEVSGCETIQGSIADDKFVAGIGPRFDYAILASVIHHVIGKTRHESKELAKKAVDNSRRLLKPGGVLFIFEPTFTPRLTMDAVFWIKRVMTSITSNRVPIGGFNNNIGAPVVSYYASDELSDLIPSGLKLIAKDVQQVKPPPLFKLTGIHRSQTILVIQKP